MVDVVTPAVRSRMMSGIRSKDTKPEVRIRSSLHRLGYRFRLHVKAMPGTPDIVLPRFKAAVFIHGCFWHGHDCHLFKLPATRQDFWREKIDKNRANDEKHLNDLMHSGWRVGVVWECAIRGAKTDFDAVISRLSDWIQGSDSFIEVRA